jgi:hypothetical protein
VPVRPRCSRKASSRVTRLATRRRHALPLTCNITSTSVQRLLSKDFAFLCGGSGQVDAVAAGPRGRRKQPRMRGRRPCVGDTGAPVEPATLPAGRGGILRGAAPSPGTPLPAAERGPSAIYNGAEPRAGRTGDHDVRSPPPGDARRDRRGTHPAVSLAIRECPARRRAASAGPYVP